MGWGWGMPIHKKESVRESVEDWSPRRFYNTMRKIFRPVRENPTCLVVIPFHLNRPLLSKEFRGCAEHYITARRKEYLARLFSSQQGRRPQSPKSEQWPDLEGLGLSQEEFWNYETPLAQLYFAETKQAQAQARRQARGLAQRGPIRARQMLKNVVLKTPQAKRRFSGLELLKLVEYRAERQFVWAFLRKESEMQKNDIKKSLRGSTTEDLARAYWYLRLRPQDIANGLRCSYQADKDTAEEFGISASAVRSLLSKSSRR